MCERVIFDNFIFNYLCPYFKIIICITILFWFQNMFSTRKKSIWIEYFEILLRPVNHCLQTRLDINKWQSYLLFFSSINSVCNKYIFISNKMYSYVSKILNNISFSKIDLLHNNYCYEEFFSPKKINICYKVI